MLGRKCKHPHLAEAEFAELSFQLQISCDICNKLPVMRGVAHPQRIHRWIYRSFRPQLSLKKVYFPAQEAKRLRWKHSCSLCGLWSSPGAPHWPGLCSPLKCLQNTGWANTGRRRGPGPYTPNSLTSVLRAEANRLLFPATPLKEVDGF